MVANAVTSNQYYVRTKCARFTKTVIASGLLTRCVYESYDHVDCTLIKSLL